MAPFLFGLESMVIRAVNWSKTGLERPRSKTEFRQGCGPRIGPVRKKPRPDRTDLGPDLGKRIREEGRKMARLTRAIRHDRATYFVGHGQAANACGMGRNLAQSDRVIRHDCANMSTQKKQANSIYRSRPKTE